MTRTNPLRDLALIVVFAALIVVCAILPAIKTGGAVPITLQTFGVLLAGAVLGPVRGFLAVALYLALGCMGFPVFSGGASGIAVLGGATGGYLIGMLFGAALCGFLVSRIPRGLNAGQLPLIFIAGLFSSAVFIHTLGMTGLVVRADMTWAAAWKVDAVFWPGDVIKNIFMALVAFSVHRAFPDIRTVPRNRRNATVHSTPINTLPDGRETIDA